MFFKLICLALVLGHAMWISLAQPPPPRLPRFPPPTGSIFKPLSSADSAKMNEMQKNWSKLRKRVCDLTVDETKTLNDQLEECNRKSHVYRIEQLLAPCRPLKATTNHSNYLEYERNECKFEECHMNVMNSAEYQQIMVELEQMSMEEKLTKSFERFKCVSNILGIKD